MAFIPSQINKLITIATKLPGVLKFVKSAATITPSGVPGIVVALATPIVSKKIAKLKADTAVTAGVALTSAQDRLNDLENKSAEELGLTAEEISYAISVATEARDKLQDLVTNGLSFTEDEVMAMIEEEIETRVKPPILAALAPPTALMGVPVFLDQLLEFLNATDPFVEAGIPAPQAYLNNKPAKLETDASLLIESDPNAPNPKYAMWDTPPEEDSPTEKKNARGRKEKWWWTVPPQLPINAPKGGPTRNEGDWTKQRYGGLRSERAHKRLMKRLYNQ